MAHTHTYTIANFQRNNEHDNTAAVAAATDDDDDDIYAWIFTVEC